MRFEIGSFRVTDVRSGTATALRDGVLGLDRAALAGHLLEDARLSRAGIEIARPGESTRIIHVLDAVESRVKVAAGPDFPGLLGRPELVVGGRTHRLDGVAVLSTCDVPGATDSQGLKEAIVDLAGPGALYTPVGRTVNVVLELAVREGLPVPGAWRGCERRTAVERVGEGERADQLRRSARSRPRQGRGVGPSRKAQGKLRFRPTMGGYPPPIGDANLTSHPAGDTHAHSSAPFL